VEKKKKDKKRNKWKRSSSIYIYLKDDKALGFKDKEPVEIDVEDEIEKGNSVQIVGVNIGHVLDDYYQLLHMFFSSNFLLLPFIIFYICIITTAIFYIRSKTIWNFFFY